jgi:hypothetical protein
MPFDARIICPWCGKVSFFLHFDVVVFHMELCSNFQQEFAIASYPQHIVGPKRCDKHPDAVAKRHRNNLADDEYMPLFGETKASNKKKKTPSSSESDSEPRPKKKKKASSKKKKKKYSSSSSGSDSESTPEPRKKKQRHVPSSSSSTSTTSLPGVSRFSLTRSKRVSSHKQKQSKCK